MIYRDPEDFDVSALEGWVVDKSELPHELRPSPATVLLHGHESPGAVARPAHEVERVGDGELADVLLLGPPPKHAEVPLSEETREMVELQSWFPSGPLATVLVIAIALCILFIICAPIVKMTFFE